MGVLRYVMLVARGEQVRDNVINDVIEQGGVSEYNSVDEWLSDIKMSRYRDNFARCGYTHVDQLSQLSRSELVNTLGVSLVGHQKKILNSIQRLRGGNDPGRTPADPLLA